MDSWKKNLDDVVGWFKLVGVLEVDIFIVISNYCFNEDFVVGEEKKVNSLF